LAQGVYWGTRPIDRVRQDVARYRATARARKDARASRKNSEAAE
jgi:hypothetical protein